MKEILIQNKKLTEKQKFYINELIKKPRTGREVMAKYLKSKGKNNLNSYEIRNMYGEFSTFIKLFPKDFFFKIEMSAEEWKKCKNRRKHKTGKTPKKIHINWKKFKIQKIKIPAINFIRKKEIKL